jgi:ankyrin repeat protein
LAARENRPGVTAMLLAHGADPNISSSIALYPPLVIAASEGHIKVASLLLSHGAEVEGVSPNGWTALLCCAYFGYASLATVLIEQYHADVFRLSKHGCSALYLAASTGQRAMVVLLLHHHAQLDTQSYVSAAILHFSLHLAYLIIYML